MKIVVVGGVAGGASTAARIRRLDEKADIKVFERGGDVSYSNCSLPYYLGGVVGDAEDLIMMTPEGFKMRHNIDVLVRNEVLSIDRSKKTVTVKNLDTGETFDEPYDKLVLSPGATPIMPASIKGIERENVFSVRNVDDVVKIKSYIDAQNLEKVVVVGGGFVGIETAENLRLAGKDVTIVEGLNQILAPFDYDMVQCLHKELMDKGIKVLLERTVTEILDGSIKATKKDEEITIPADVVIMSIGVAPETKLAAEAGLEIGETRGIKVNNRFQTSDPDIYAVGDAIETFNAITGKPGRLALAGPAQKQARIAADNICGIDSTYKGFYGSSCIKVFDLNAASTGLNEKALEAAGIKYDFATVIPSDRVGLMPEANYMLFKLLFEVPTGKIMGAQAIGTGDTTKRVDSMAALMSMGGTIEDIKNYEHCYSPVFSTAKDVVHMAGLVAENLLEGRLKQVPVSEVRKLVEEGAYILDVREEDEFEESHLNNAINIPLSQLRERIGEIPKDKPVYIHCRSSQRGYYACRTLMAEGIDAINISGSFLGISLYEYFLDKTEGRTPILTEYNFE